MAIAGLAGAQGTSAPPATAPEAWAKAIDAAWAKAIADPHPLYDATPDDPDSVVPGANDAEGVVREVPFGSLFKPFVRKEEPAAPWARPNTGASSAIGEKFARNPVLPLGKRGRFDSGQAEYPAVVFVGDTAWMYYSAFGGAKHRWEIAVAESPDGIHWTKLGTVLAPDTVRVVDAAGASIAVWDSSTVAFPCVLYAADAPPAERFRMWYAGKSGALYDGIGFATSADGRTWVRQGRVLGAGGAGEWDAAQVVDPAVIPVDGGYRMYYCGSRDADSDFQVGLALSADGRNWVKHPENPIAKFGGNPSGEYTLDVLRDDEGYTLFVSIPNAAREYEMFALHSVDGLTFDSADRQMVLAPSRDGSWDDQMVYGMEAMELGDKVYLWFNGIYAKNVPKGGEVGLARIGKGELRRLFGGP